MDRSTGRRTRPFSTPNMVRITNTAKKYLMDGEKSGVRGEVLHMPVIYMPGTQGQR